MKIKLTKTRYTAYFFGIVAVLFCIKSIFPFIATDSTAVDDNEKAEKAQLKAREEQNSAEDTFSMNKGMRFFEKDGKTSAVHKIYSVSSYDECFPDTQATQLEAALKFGVESVLDRKDAENRKKELVYIGANPYYKIDNLTRSIPYLVPKAATLLQDIGKAFSDSLQIKGMEPYRLVITSVLRSQADVEKLRKTNYNATENSCHLYGTTIDISYTKFLKVENPNNNTPLRDCPSDKLKWILSEVLRDFRENGRCFIKHENKQSVFHLTVCK